MKRYLKHPTVIIVAINFTATFVFVSLTNASLTDWWVWVFIFALATATTAAAAWSVRKERTPSAASRIMRAMGKKLETPAEVLDSGGLSLLNTRERPTMTVIQTQYVLDVEHETDCFRRDDRSALFLRREIAESLDAYFASDEDGEFISADGRWSFEESLEPITLVCSGCSASRYVATDSDENVVALTRENCPRSTFYLGHYGQMPCKYCGHGGKK